MNLIWVIILVIGWLPAGYSATRLLNAWNILAMVIGTSDIELDKNGSLDLLAPWRSFQWNKAPRDPFVFRVGVLGGWFSFAWLLAAWALGMLLYVWLVAVFFVWCPVASKTFLPLATALWSSLGYLTPGKKKSR